MEEMNQILEGLYLGPYKCATRTAGDNLFTNGIRYIICFQHHRDRPRVMALQHSFIRYTILDSSDSSTDSIVPQFRSVNHFINQIRQRPAFGSSVLVQGFKGVSRSAAFVIAYVMYRRRISLQNALRFVRARRPCINPTPHFLAQLMEYEQILRPTPVTVPRPTAAVQVRPRRALKGGSWFWAILIVLIAMGVLVIRSESIQTLTGGVRNNFISVGSNKLISQQRFEVNQEGSLASARPDFLTWYACGPTVYDSSHIGHASSYVRLDVIRRILESQNVQVLQVMGITDIDDKIIGRASRLNLPWEEVGRKYELEFKNELELLNVKRPHIFARVSDFIPNIIQFVADLVNSKNAYVTTDGSVYFDTKNYPHYGKFVPMKEAENFVTEEQGQGKSSPRDFALWKSWKPGEPFWETPWGKGRPGWHIECSAIATHFFGHSLDIHSGGIDLKFPHHENEEAQCCAKFGSREWVTKWIHTGHLSVKGDEKMSKSLGNTVTIQKFLEDNSADTLRMLCIMDHYTSHIEYTADSVKHASQLLGILITFLNDSESILCGAKTVSASPQQEVNLWESLIESRKGCAAALTEDFQTDKAVHIVHELIKEYNLAYTTVKSPMNSGIDFSLVLACRVFVKNFIDLVGLGSEGRDALESQLVDPIMSTFLEFRRRVRTYSLAQDEHDKATRVQKVKERKELVDACDEARKDMSHLGINVTDHFSRSSWAYKREK